MKMRNTPKKLMLGVGLTAAAAVAMTPMVKSMVNKMNRQDNSLR